MFFKIFLFNNKTLFIFTPSCFASFNLATVKSSCKHSQRPTLAFKFWTNFFTKHVTFNNFSKLLYLSQSMTQQTFQLILMKMLTQLILPLFVDSNSKNDLGHTSSPSCKNDGPLNHNTSSNFIFFVISCSNICRITINWYITPTINTYIFSNL